MRLCLIRHGETDWNAEQRLQGWTDVALNAEGERQARAAARELLGVAFDTIVASPLQRARATAEAIAAGRPVTLDARLRERHHGELQGLTRGEIAAVAPRVHEDLLRGAPATCRPAARAWKCLPRACTPPSRTCATPASACWRWPMAACSTWPTAWPATRTCTAHASTRCPTRH
jgi:broad specificity phosphatase PhoE